MFWISSVHDQSNTALANNTSWVDEHPERNKRRKARSEIGDDAAADKDRITEKVSPLPVACQWRGEEVRVQRIVEIQRRFEWGVGTGAWEHPRPGNSNLIARRPFISQTKRNDSQCNAWIGDPMWCMYENFSTFPLVLELIHRLPTFPMGR